MKLERKNKGSPETLSSTYSHPTNIKLSDSCYAKGPNPGLKGDQPVAPSLELGLAKFQAYFLSPGEVKSPSP